MTEVGISLFSLIGNKNSQKGSPLIISIKGKKAALLFYGLAPFQWLNCQPEAVSGCGWAGREGGEGFARSSLVSGRAVCFPR